MAPSACTANGICQAEPNVDWPRVQALEALRKLRTEKAQEVKELKLKLEHTKTLKDQAAVGAALLRLVVFAQ